MEEAAAAGMEETAGVEAAIGMKDEIDFIDEGKERVLVAFLINLQMLIAGTYRHLMPKAR